MRKVPKRPDSGRASRMLISISLVRNSVERLLGVAKVASE